MQTLSIISTARDALRGLMLSLCELVYSLISFCFQVFYNLGKANILNNDILETYLVEELSSTRFLLRCHYLLFLRKVVEIIG